MAAENFWGSIAQQLGGGHVHVKSIIDNPAADPHDYEPTAADGRAVATARYTIVNGIGYDAWANKLLSANPGSDRTELKVGDLVGVRPGGNPHRWYAPADVHKVIEKIPPTTRRSTRTTPPSTTRGRRPIWTPPWPPTVGWSPASSPLTRVRPSALPSPSSRHSPRAWA